MDTLRRDDILSARALPPAEKLSRALEVMAYGLELKRQNLERDRPEATATEIEQAFDAWLFERG